MACPPAPGAGRHWALYSRACLAAGWRWRPRIVALGGLCPAGRHRRGGLRFPLCGLAARQGPEWPTPSASPKPPPEPMSPGRSRARTARCSTATRSIASWLGITEGEIPPPPELALGRRPVLRVLYRLARDAAEGEPARKPSLWVPALEIAAAVRPLGDGQAAWWFTPRLDHSARAPSQTPKHNRRSARARSALRCSAMRPWAWHLPTNMARSSKPITPSPISSACPALAPAG